MFLALVFMKNMSHFEHQHYWFCLFWHVQGYLFHWWWQFQSCFFHQLCLGQKLLVFITVFANRFKSFHSQWQIQELLLSPMVAISGIAHFIVSSGIACVIYDDIFRTCLFHMWWQVQDLLNPSETDLPIREDGNHNIFVAGLTEKVINNFNDFKNLFGPASNNR